MPQRAVLLFTDETILRLFPPLRAAWAPRGEQAVVRITGANARRVLIGAVNPRTGHRLVLRRQAMRQPDFQAFLSYLRRCYPRRQIWLLLDQASCHIAPTSQALATELDIVLVWLPKQCAELNAMDHLWRELKGHIAANRQYASIDEHADSAEHWLLGLTPRQSLRKAGVLSDGFWLRHFLQNFWPPT